MSLLIRIFLKISMRKILREYEVNSRNLNFNLAFLLLTRNKATERKYLWCYTPSSGHFLNKKFSTLPAHCNTLWAPGFSWSWMGRVFADCLVNSSWEAGTASCLFCFTPQESYCFYFKELLLASYVWVQIPVFVTRGSTRGLFGPLEETGKSIPSFPFFPSSSIFRKWLTVTADTKQVQNSSVKKSFKKYIVSGRSNKECPINNL